MDQDQRGDEHDGGRREPQQHRGTPYRLRDEDEWGVRVVGTGASVEAGDTVTVEAKSGRTWVETVGRVIKRFDDGNAIVAGEGKSGRGAGRAAGPGGPDGASGAGPAPADGGDGPDGAGPWDGGDRDGPDPIPF